MNRPLRIALDARSLSSTVLRGMDRYTLELAGGLTRLGVDVTLFHRAGEPPREAHLNEASCRVRAIRDYSAKHWEQVSVPWALWRGKFDLYHAPAERAVPLAAPCPVVQTIHSVTAHSYRDLVQRNRLPGKVEDYLGCQIPSSHRFSTRYHHAAYRRAHHTFAPSDFSRSEIIRFFGIPHHRVTTTPLAVAKQFHQSKAPKEKRSATLRRLGVRDPYVLFVGGYEKHKNTEGLLQAFARAKSIQPALSLVLVGTKAVPDSLLSLAAQLGLSVGGDVICLCDLNDELVDLYDGARMFVSLSWRETFCLPALEAVTRGLPAVVSVWGATSEVIAEAGRYVDPRSEEAASNEILRVFDSCDPTAFAGTARKVAARFDWRKTAAKTLDVYERIVSRSRKVA